MYAYITISLSDLRSTRKSTISSKKIIFFFNQWYLKCDWIFLLQTSSSVPMGSRRHVQSPSTPSKFTWASRYTSTKLKSRWICHENRWNFIVLNCKDFLGKSLVQPLPRSFESGLRSSVFLFVFTVSKILRRFAANLFSKCNLTGGYPEQHAKFSVFRIECAAGDIFVFQWLHKKPRPECSEVVPVPNI